MDLDSYGEFLPSSSSTYTVDNRVQQIAQPQKPRKKLTTVQIIAIVLLGFVVVGIVMMVLAFVGVFNTTGPTISLTPSVSPAAASTAISVIPYA